LPDDIKELLLLVRAERLFAVQDWIESGKPLQPISAANRTPGDTPSAALLPSPFIGR